jgi:hypothetical protein
MDHLIILADRPAECKDELLLKVIWERIAPNDFSVYEL